jgi:hypothetical protein
MITCNFSDSANRLWLLTEHLTRLHYASAHTDDPQDLNGALLDLIQFQLEIRPHKVDKVECLM